MLTGTLNTLIFGHMFADQYDRLVTAPAKRSLYGVKPGGHTYSVGRARCYEGPWCRCQHYIIARMRLRVRLAAAATPASLTVHRSPT